MNDLLRTELARVARVLDGDDVEFVLERPRDETHGDLATNLALTLARRKRPENMAAYDLVLRALPHLWAHRREDNAEAIRLLDRAMELDSSYARAAAIAAWARAQHVVYNWTDDIETIRNEGERLIVVASPAVGDDPTALCALSTATHQPPRRWPSCVGQLPCTQRDAGPGAGDGASSAWLGFRGLSIPPAPIRRLPEGAGP